MGKGTDKAYGNADCPKSRSTMYVHPLPAGLIPRSNPSIGDDPLYRPRPLHDPSHPHPIIQFTPTLPPPTYRLLHIPCTPSLGLLAPDVPLFTTRTNFRKGMFGNYRPSSGPRSCGWKEDWECIGELLWCTVGCIAESGNTWSGGSRRRTMFRSPVLRTSCLIEGVCS